MHGAKRKTIRRVLRAKVEDWLKTIKNKDVRKIAAENVIITGGSIASLLSGEKINDFDFYFRTLESTLAMAIHYVEDFVRRNPGKTVQPYVKVAELENIRGEKENRVGVWVQSAGATGEGCDDSEYQYYEITDNAHGDSANEYINELIGSLHGNKKKEELPDGQEADDKYRPVYMSQNAISLSDKVQLVIRFYGEPSQIHENYDFVHAMCSYDYHRDVLNMPAEALESLMSKSLIYKGSLYPICSVFRMKKFIERGWRITAGEILKMCFQISELDLNDPYTLREQLTGVDAAYFHELIALIDEWKKNNENKSIESSYIVGLIDEVFENDAGRPVV